MFPNGAVLFSQPRCKVLNSTINQKIKKTNLWRLHTTEYGFYIEEVDQELFSPFLSVDCDFKLQQKMEQTNDHLQSFLNIWIADYSENYFSLYI